MSKYVQDEKPPITEGAQNWLEQEARSQEDRYKEIVAEMDGIEGDREQWYAEFLEIIQTKGFSVTGDERRAISKEELPEKPDRPDAMRVVW